MEVLAASALSISELSDLWGAVYEGYQYRMSHTPDLLERMVRSGSIRLDRSPLLVEDGRPVALSFLGVRGGRGWIGSFGVRAEHRGRGLAARLMEVQRQQAAALGLSTVQLEVLRGNGTARRVYERAGFTVTREVLVLQGDAGTYPATETAGADGAGAIGHAEGLALLRALRRREPPAWQREPEAVEAAGGAAYLAWRDKGALVYQGRPAGVRIVDLAVDRSVTGRSRTAALRSLLTLLREAAPGVPAVLINEPEEELAAALLAEGFRETDRQYEMLLPLANGGHGPERGGDR
jgi:ribosomal protein S18 acetylase RimI-like enzyme